MCPGTKEFVAPSPAHARAEEQRSSVALHPVILTDMAHVFRHFGDRFGCRLGGPHCCGAAHQSAQRKTYDNQVGAHELMPPAVRFIIGQLTRESKLKRVGAVSLGMPASKSGLAGYLRSSYGWRHEAAA